MINHSLFVQYNTTICSFILLCTTSLSIVC